MKRLTVKQWKELAPLPVPELWGIRHDCTVPACPGETLDTQWYSTPAEVEAIGQFDTRLDWLLPAHSVDYQSPYITSSLAVASEVARRLNATWPERHYKVQQE